MAFQWYAINYTLKSMVTQRITLKTINSRIKTISKQSKYASKNILELTDEDKQKMLEYIKDVRSRRNKGNITKVFTELVIDFRETEVSYEKYKINLFVFYSIANRRRYRKSGQVER